MIVYDGIALPGDALPPRRPSETSREYIARMTPENWARAAFVAKAVGHADPRFTVSYYYHNEE
jgi:hypothetical protein